MGVHILLQKQSVFRSGGDPQVIRRCSPSRFRNTVLAVGIGIGMMGCSLSDLVKVDNPNEAITPIQVSTVAGALGLYGGTIGLMNAVYGAQYGDVVLSGTLADEFQDTSSAGIRIDVRNPSLETNRVAGLYKSLQYVRTQGLQTVVAMKQFPTGIPTPLIGRVYAIVGYSELLMAERFCSGIPLSVLAPDGGAITYSPGVPTSELFERAVAHFDTAISLIGTDSLRFRYLAQVGRGRALMGLHRYADAAISVASVPTEFTYNAEFSAADSNAVRPQTGGTVFTSDTREGGNGINWLAAQDPRVPIHDTVNGLVRTSKYATRTSPIVVADGIEARLIEAEDRLAEGDPSWLTILNTLRARIVLPDGSRALADTTDPGTLEAQVDLLFRERAFWLYATGHRHGDLRRLVRQYRRPQSAVFPSGPYAYPTSYFISYSSGVMISIPPAGHTNPFFQGCLDTNA